jgi:hypothetical protein
VIFDGSRDQALAVLGAMASVARDGNGELSPAAHGALTSAAHLVFRVEDVGPEALGRPSPAELAAVLGDRGAEAVVPLVVMATVDGHLEQRAVDRVRDYAAALGVDDPAVADLEGLVSGHLALARADMLRRNRSSITGEWVQDTSGFGQWIQPYRDAPDPALAERYRALGGLPEGTFGRTFHQFYVDNGFSFAGDPESANEQFTTPHDSAHVLSGYDTSVQGELLVSTFTAGMHRDQGLAGHILPVIASWQLGIPLVDFAGSTTGALDARKFWVAWARGDVVDGDTFAADWDFWAHVEHPLHEVRSTMTIPALDPDDAADGKVPAWYHPSA